MTSKHFRKTAKKTWRGQFSRVMFRLHWPEIFILWLSLLFQPVKVCLFHILICNRKHWLRSIDSNINVLIHFLYQWLCFFFELCFNVLNYLAGANIILLLRVKKLNVYCSSTIQTTLMLILWLYGSRSLKQILQQNATSLNDIDKLRSFVAFHKKN